MEQTIHSLIAFDHSYILNYPTVMFSTGPMFLSAQFGLYTASHPPSPEHPGGDVRVLPKSLYGKNAKLGEAPNSFFSHHYGSSWHADDAAFITFLGTWGKALMWVGLVILIIGITRLVWQKKSKGHHGERERRRIAFGRYDVVLPRAYHQDGSFHLDLGFVTMSEPSGITTEPPTPTSSFSSEPPSPGEHPLLPLSFGARPSSSGMPSDNSRESVSLAMIATRAFHQAGTWVRASVTGYSESRPRRRSQNRGVMFFLPAIFTPSSSPPLAEHDIPLLASQSSVAPQGRSRSRSPLHQRKDSEDLVLSDAGSHTARTQQPGSSTVRVPPPPYERSRGGPPHVSAEWIAGEAGWDEWAGSEDTS
jgi:inositol phosphorylceramide mannosyltransferase catalytic subunit